MFRVVSLKFCFHVYVKYRNGNFGVIKTCKFGKVVFVLIFVRAENAMMHRYQSSRECSRLVLYRGYFSFSWFISSRVL